MRINKLLELFYMATGYKIKTTHHGYKFEVTTDLITAEISLAEIKRQCRSYCARCIEQFESNAAYCEDADGAAWFSECADNWRRTLESID